MVTLADLRAQTSKELAKLARNEGVSGWHSMRKEQLVQAILRVARRRSGNSGDTRGRKPRNKPDESAKQSRIAAQIERENRRAEEMKNIAFSAAVRKENDSKPTKDRVIMVVRDAYWMQVYWEITSATVDRARTALDKYWRGSRPILRLLEVPRDGDVADERVERDIPIHGGVNNWYIDAQTPQRRWRVAIGYLSPKGRFYMIARSNIVTTPADNSGPDDAHWADIASNCEAVYAMSGGFDPDNESSDLRDVFESKMHRPMASLNGGHLHGVDELEKFSFEVDAQMIVYGAVPAGSTVAIGGEPLKVQPDGTFSTRMELPDRRQVLPVVVCSRDGSQQRTTVIAVERNTKVMEPISCDMDDA